ncbi:hypothetical protein PIB30_030569 [Stylosanthes scabra]|uniref:F-box associated domain-containing protein n=1 Tax=Stylosanthes scabra TaxID=79078 RepID=A0ABU6TCP1_9FABA|nr:hypothetical protein [Stylosanthes scabra]
MLGTRDNLPHIRSSSRPEQFEHILIPPEARSTMTRLLVHQECLCFAFVHRSEGTYQWLIWKILDVQGARSWRLCTEYRGIGLPEFPECFQGNEIVTIQDTTQFRTRSNSGATTINFTTVNPVTHMRSALQSEFAPFSFYVRSLTLSLESVVPVDGDRV